MRRVIKRQVGDVTVVDVDGNIELGDAEKMEVMPKLEKGGKFLLNLERVRKFDDSEIRRLNQAQSTGQLKMYNIHKIKEYSTLTTLVTTFDCLNVRGVPYVDEAEAIRSFS